MKSRTWLKDLVEEWSYEHYLKQNPSLVEGIKKLLIAGEKPSKVRQFCKQVSGKANLTASTIGHMIDYVNKQIKN
jgi:hypothetical protein